MRRGVNVLQYLRDDTDEHQLPVSEWDVSEPAKHAYDSAELDMRTMVGARSR